MSGVLSPEKQDNRISAPQLMLLILVFLAFFLTPFFPNIFSDNQFYGIDANRKAPEFTLSDLAGEKRSLTDFRGNPVFLMFGYLNCDGLCHNQVLLFQEINALISASSSAPSSKSPVFLYVAMDPERDDVKKVAKYFDAHADNFISLNADSFKQAQAVAMDYGAYFSKKGQLSSGGYEIEHPGHIFLIDPLGNLRFTYSAQHKQAERMVSDLRYLQVEH